MNRQTWGDRVRRLVEVRGFNVVYWKPVISHIIVFGFSCPCGRLEAEYFQVPIGCSIRKAASIICADLRRHVTESMGVPT